MELDERCRMAVCQLLAGKEPEMEPDATAAAAIAEALGRACWQVLPALQPCIPQKWDEFREMAELRRAAGALATYGRLHTSITLELADRFDAADVDYVLLKSSATRFSAFAKPDQRVGWDIDLAVPPDQMLRAERVARAMYFQPAELDTHLMRFVPGNEDRRTEILGTHYEMAFLVYRADIGEAIGREARATLANLPIAPAFHDAGTKTICDVALDIHHALSLDIGAEVVFEDRRQVPAGRRTLTVPRPGALAFHAIFKLYWEGVHTYGKGLYQYADLVRLVPQLDAGECQIIIDNLKAHHLDAAGLFVLQRLPDAFGVALPDRLACWLHEVACYPRTGEPAQHNDFGDLWPRLWSRASLGV